MKSLVKSGFLLCSKRGEDMATIRTSINMVDNLSPVFQSINSALQLTVSGFEHLQDASGSAIDISRLQQAQRELARVDEMFNQIEKEIREADNVQGQFNNRIRDGTNAMDGLLGKVVAILGAYLSFQGVKNVLSMADGVANTTARLAIMNDNLQTTAELNDEILASANRTFSPFDDTADMVAKLGILARDAFASNDEAIAFAEILNKHFVISGTSVAGTQAAMLQLTQAMASGVLRGEELNSVFEQAPTLIQNIADYLGVGTGKIKEMASDGEITANVVKKAMFAMADETNARFQSMPNTFSDIWNVVLNDIGATFGDFFAKLTSISDSEKFKEALLQIVSTLKLVAIVAEWVLDALIFGANLVYDNWSLIEPLIVGITAALIINAGAWAWVNRELAINAIMMATTSLRNLWYIATTVLSTWATYGFTAAMAALSIAISANPIAWLIGAVVVIITLFYLGVAAVNKFAGTSYSATGIIAGAFTVAGAIIMNVLFGIAEITFGVIEALYNRWIAFANFFANVFNDPVASIIHLFGDLADNVLGVIEKIASALDFVFGSNLASTVAGWRNSLADLVNWAAEEYGEGTYEVLFEELDINKELEKLGLKAERFDYGKAWDTGYNWGANLFNQDKLGNENSSVEDAIKNALALGDKLDTGNDAGKKTAKNTGKMADEVKLLNDELKYLRDLTEREAINRYTTAEIKIDNRGEYHINQDLDIDGIIDRMGEKVEEVAERLAEGDAEFV